MRVLHVSKFYHPYKGGIENVVKSLVEGSLKVNHEVDVLCFDSSDIYDNPEKRNCYNPTIFRFKKILTLFSQPISLAYVYKLLSIRNNYDIIHLHLPNPLALIPLLHCKSKIVVHWHSDIVEQKFLYQILKIFHKRILNISEKIIFTSDNYRDSSEQIFGFKEKSVVIPIGIPDYIQKYTPINKNKNHTRVFALGRLVQYKGFEKLIKCSKLLDENIEVIIAGNGPLKSQLQRLINKLNLESKVKLVGFASDIQIHEYFKSADIFCLPSITRNEAYGVVLLEAMSHSLPIVTFDIKGSGVPWVNKNHFSGIVVSEISSIALARAINEINRDTNLQENLSLNSRERYMDLFTVERMQSSTNDLYESILKLPK